MAYITKRGNSYSVRYTYEDEHGKSCDKWESFPTKEEATNRKKQIEHELAAGTFLIPSSVTVAEFLMDWLPKQCSKHKWAPKTYESNLSPSRTLLSPISSGSADLMQNPTHIFKQFRPLQNLLAKITTVQKPCIDRALPDFSELHNKKERQILRFDVQYLVHLAHSYPNFSPLSRLRQK